MCKTILLAKDELAGSTQHALEVALAPTNTQITVEDGIITLDVPSDMIKIVNCRLRTLLGDRAERI